MATELQGQLERITFHNDENHYTIAKIKVQGQKNLVTVVGNLVSVSPGEMLRLQGDWDIHPKYGQQFRVSSYETVIPATVKGIERYLGSGLIKGIGPVMAKRLINAFAEKTLDIIEHDSGRLTEVEGIGTKRIDLIRTAWAEQKEIREVMLFLQGHEVSAAYAARIFRQYGRDSIRVVRDNPYRLAADIFGVGFLTADKIARKLGIPEDAAIRAEEGILYVLQQMADEGHVYYPRAVLVEECFTVLAINEAIINASLEKLAADKRVIITEENVYLTLLYNAEKGIAEFLSSFLSSPRDPGLLTRDPSLESLQKDLSIHLAEKQKLAVLASLKTKVCIITGGPGTGKTTIIRAILSLYRRSGQRILLAAPTGRAAKRMSEVSGQEAKTIHRLLEFNPKLGGFSRNDSNPLGADLVIIDEASMIDTVLMYHLLRAVPRQAALIFVGDVDQLPSVGPGNVLRDIINSGTVQTIMLREIFRQSGESLIIRNAHRINNDEFPVLSSTYDVPQDFYFIECEDPEEAAQKVVSFCAARIPQKFGYHPVRDIQVLSPMHRGIIGAANLNIELQRCLNPSTDLLIRGGRTLKTGDKVMQIRNNYDKDVFNGDIGTVLSIDREDQHIRVDFDGRPVTYEFAELDEIVLAYAISVHKSQGSEYPVVVMPLLTQHYMMLQKNLLYTAITRGKKLVIIVGTKKALGIAIRNNKPQMRHTGLRERLASLMRI
ncbi:MAG: SF1B family DNA helicase RecD2 [Thermodesulfovibrionales bacterium]